MKETKAKGTAKATGTAKTKRAGGGDGGVVESVSKIPAEVRLAYVAPSASVVKVFAGQCSEKRAYEYGARTNGAALARDMPGFLAAAAGLIRDHGALIDYDGTRFAYLVVRATELEHAVAVQKHDDDGTARGKSQLERAEKMAREVRADLVHKLGEVVDGDEDEAPRFARQRGEVDSRAKLSESLDAMVAQASDLVGSPKEKWQVLCASHRLDRATVDNAAAVAGALAQALGRRGTSERTDIDSPAVNLAEGYVAFEVVKLWRAIERGRERSKRVRLPVVGGELRKLIAHAKRAAKPATAGSGEAPSSSGSTPGAGPSA